MVKPGEVGRTSGGFVGRALELQVLVRGLEDVGAGGSRAVAVVGEPGIGKTWLVRELRERAQGLGWATAMGRGSELALDAPFGLLTEALGDAVAELGPLELKRLGQECLAELGVVFPTVRTMADRVTGSLDVERFRCHYAVRELLKLLIRGRPLLLVLDDMQWADPASIELVSYLLRHSVGGYLLALAYRPQAPNALLATVERAVREGTLRQLELGPLSPEEASEMLGRSQTPSRLAALYAESGGNPFYLDQLARAPGALSEVHLPQGARPSRVRDVPAAVQSAIQQELAALSPSARRLAHSAAVAGDPFEIDLALEIAELKEPGAGAGDAGADLGWAALDELTSSGVLTPAEPPTQFQFRHPIMRRAVYDAAGYGWRLGAHRRAARCLADRSAPLGAQAEHIVRSSAPGADDDALALLVEASRDASPRAPAAAVHWLESAVRFLPADAPAQRRLELLAPLAKAQAAVGLFQDCSETLVQALDLAPATSGERVDLTLTLANAHHELGRLDEARQVLETALAEAPPATSQAGELTAELAKNHSMSGRWGEAEPKVAEALRLARELDDRPLLVTATICDGFFRAVHLGAVAPSDRDEARARAQAALREAERGVDGLADDEYTPTLIEALVVLANAQVTAKRWSTAERLARRGVDICRSRGEGMRFLYCKLTLVPALMYQGRLAEARAESDEVTEATHLLDLDPFVVTSESLRCWVTSLQGETSVALAAGARALDAAERAPDAEFAWMAPACYGEALAEAGRLEEGARHILLAGGRELKQIPPSARPRWHRVLAEIYLATGATEDAEAMAELAGATGDRQRLPGNADACYAEAAVLLARDQIEAASISARAAVERYTAAGVPQDAARARLLEARALVGSGDSEGAVKVLEDAYATLDQCGAVRLADRAARELRKLGRRVARRSVSQDEAPSTGPASLTKREREVAALVAQGRTTREIAKELFLSPKTIETHLAHIFAKLGVSSRAAMTATLSRTTVLDEELS